MTLRSGNRMRDLCPFVIALLASTVWALAQTNTPAPDAELPIYKDPDCPIEERVPDLISRMTLLEKVSQIEIESQPIERLGVPYMNWWSEGAHGVGRAGRATVFPVSIAMAATWDVDLNFRVASAIGDEARAKHKEDPNGRYRGLTYWTPCVNMCRDPRWGRLEEAYGEDPYLVGRMGVAYTKGMQGNDPRYLKTAATPKHFAVHSQETDRHRTSFPVSERQIREYYLPAFRDCFVEGKAVSCMAAFNGVNGLPCVANWWLLTEILRGEWGFDGAIVTDWGATGNLFKHYEVVGTNSEAIAVAISAGVDVICEHKPAATNILEAVQGGLLAEAQIDQALARSLKVRFRLGMFDPPEHVPYTRIETNKTGCAEHIALALELSQSSIVLLKNERAAHRADPSPLLPLDRRTIESIAVLGSHAYKPFLGNYSGDPAFPPVTPLQGILNHVSERVVVRTAPWFDLDEKKPVPKPGDPPPISQKDTVAAAVKAAAESDVAIVCVGLGPKIEREGRDRTDMNLPQDQQEFVEKIVEANPATVVVLINGSPLTINWIQEHVPAIVEAWYPGEQGGNAIAQVLFGDYNPAGRLPITFYASLDQLPPLFDYDITKGRTYMYLKTPPLYPFGYGLSYTKFEYSNLQLDAQKVGTNGTVHVSVNVKNVGPRDGDEVVQLYIHNAHATVPVPIKQLRGFRRLHIPSGQTRTVTFSIAVPDLALWDEETHGWKTDPGAFDVMVGASSADIRLRSSFRVE